MNRLLLLLAVLTVTGCGAMPGSGPTSLSLLDSPGQVSATRPFDLFDLDAETLATLASFEPATLSGRFPASPPSPVQKIGVGDVLGVTIFEASSGGLFIGLGGELGTGSKNVALPAQAVEADGTIGIPYAGRIKAAERTPSEVAQNIEERLAGKAIDPRAVVTVTQNQSNRATVSGQVGAPGRIPVFAGGDRLLDVLANAGGPQGNPNELFVRVTRGEATAISPLHSIIKNPSENIFIWPGDTVTVVREPQIITAFGATGNSGNFPFEHNRTSLAEAVGAARGLDDARADPAAIFLYRMERREIVCALRGQRDCPNLKNTSPVIYRLDLSQPEGIFHAKQMLVQNDDVLYIANADSAQLLKFLRLIGTAVGTARGTGNLLEDLN